MMSCALSMRYKICVGYVHRVSLLTADTNFEIQLHKRAGMVPKTPTPDLLFKSCRFEKKGCSKVGL